MNLHLEKVKSPIIRRTAVIVFMPYAFVMHLWYALRHGFWPGFKSDVKAVW